LEIGRQRYRGFRRGAGRHDRRRFGYGSREVIQRIREARPSMGILVVDEQETTLQARERYWEHHKRRGWRRFVPATMFLPPEPFDDFVALILAERVLLV